MFVSIRLTRWLVTAGLVLIPGTSAASDPVVPLSDQLTYTPRDVRGSHGDCEDPDSDCATIVFQYPEFLTAPTDEIRQTLNSYVREYVHKPMFKGQNPKTFDVLIQDFIDDYKKLQQEVDDYTTGWRVERKVGIPYWNDDVISLRLSEYASTGGAHPLYTENFVNFDLSSGRQLRLDDLFDDGYEDRLLLLAEREFRDLKLVDAGTSLSDAGYNFDGDRFSLNDNFTIGAFGITFRFNPYEIAPYAFGATDILVAYEDLGTLTKDDGPLALAAGTSAGDKAEVRAVVEDFLVKLGSLDFDGVAGFLTADAYLVMMKESGDGFARTVITGKDWIARLKSTDHEPFREILSNVRITIDYDAMAHLHADFRVFENDKILLHGIDNFTLVKDDGAWKIAIIAYTSREGGPRD